MVYIEIFLKKSFVPLFSKRFRQIRPWPDSLYWKKESFGITILRIVLESKRNQNGHYVEHLLECKLTKQVYGSELDGIEKLHLYINPRL